jgi:hypothetical protein
MLMSYLLSCENESRCRIVSGGGGFDISCVKLIPQRREGEAVGWVELVGP